MFKIALKFMYLREAQQKLSANQTKNAIYSDLRLKPNNQMLENVTHVSKISLNNYNQATQVDLDYDSEAVRPIKREHQIGDFKETLSDIKSESDDKVIVSLTPGQDELINKAKLQMENLNNSFNLLIEHQNSKQKSLTYGQIDFQQKHLKFNKNIKAYVDVCCSSPDLVS